MPTSCLLRRRTATVAALVVAVAASIATRPPRASTRADASETVVIEPATAVDFEVVVVVGADDLAGAPFFDSTAFVDVTGTGGRGDVDVLVPSGDLLTVQDDVPTDAQVDVGNPCQQGGDLDVAVTETTCTATFFVRVHSIGDEPIEATLAVSADLGFQGERNLPRGAAVDVTITAGEPYDAPIPADTDAPDTDS